MIVRHVSKCIFLITISAQTCWSCTVPCIYPSHIETVSDLNERGNMSSGKLNVAAATRRQGTLCGDLYGQAVAGTSSIGCSHFSTCEGSKWDGQHWTSLITLKKRGSDEGKRNCIDSLTHWLFTSYIGLFVNFVNDICQFLSMVSGFPELPPALARGDPCSAVCSCTGGDFGSGCRLYSPAHLDIWKNLLDLVLLLIHTQYIYIL